MKHPTVQDKRGMAMVIVLAASFVVLAIIGVGAGMLAGSLDKVGGRGDRQKAEANAISGIERVRGMQAVDGRLTDACSALDCINTGGGGCSSCADGLYTNGDNRHRVQIEILIHPQAGGGGIGVSDPTVGSATLLATGYYKNLIAQRRETMCLAYCIADGRNCGDDGCGGSCGTCVEPATCSEVGVCQSPTSCSDSTMECDDACVEGDVCGGGTVIDATNNIVAIPGGCQNETGNKCDQGPDNALRIWDNDGDYEQTGATDGSDGRNNSIALNTETNTNFEAVKFCDDMSWNGFSNWYLPAQGEMDYLNLAIANGWANNFEESICYWSSTDEGHSSAFANYITTLGIGSPCDHGKSNSYLIRCLRRY